jgi:hypothetical protein
MYVNVTAISFKISRSFHCIFNSRLNSGRARKDLTWPHGLPSTFSLESKLDLDLLMHMYLSFPLLIITRWLYQNIKFAFYGEFFSLIFLFLGMLCIFICLLPSHESGLASTSTISNCKVYMETDFPGDPRVSTICVYLSIYIYIYIYIKGMIWLDI